MRVGSYLGIPLKVNPLFFVLLGVAAACGFLAQTLILFAILMWHESAHVLLAKLYRLEVTDIELLPFGGVARIEALLQTNPTLEWRIALVGPLANIVLIGAGYVVYPHIHVPPELYEFFL